MDDVHLKVVGEFLRFVSLLIEGAKQSRSNVNQGFVDWRDLCALRGELPTARAALEAVVPMPASARVPEGWQLVPVEPTVEMMCAGDDTGFHTYTGTWSITPDACWQAMLAAAPKSEAEE